MEQAQDPALVGAIAALIGAIALMIRQNRNGHANGNGNGESKINAEVERRVKYHDLRNELNKIAISVETQRVESRNDRENFQEFRDEIRDDLSFIKAKLQIDHERGVARG